MKSVWAVGFFLAAAAPALGQFSILSIDRRVEALAALDYAQASDCRRSDHQIFQAADSQPLIAAASVSAISVAPGCGAAAVTAWQDATISPNEIRVTGGVRDAETSGGLPRFFGQSTATVRFSLDRQHHLRVLADVTQPPEQHNPNFVTFVDYIIFSGDVSYSLVGPNASLRVAPPRVSVETESRVPVAFVPERRDDMLILEAGTYTLTAGARQFSQHGFSINPNLDTYRDVAYDVQVTAIGMPEPSTYAMAAISLIGLWCVRKHFTKSARSCASAETA